MASRTSISLSDGGEQMGRESHLLAYCVNPRFQYNVDGIGMDDALLEALRNVIYKIEHDPEATALCLEESKIFREGNNSFGQAAVVSKQTMNSAEWWVYFGGSARNLKRIAIRILSQTVFSSSCERNWWSFTLIHNKQRNRLI
ncbi:uncharacterized protein LOC120105604 [Phoenix dactylifera]|uniref:Uncharacterized protein LOC120105604 n=1 Tax=Phoenix dactylifera TaxID=42345 RepID=A0A8B8ZLD8_PHODC|nr:uncharacterized protein LOC120105604 [Phoenix dactylifera]